MVPNKFIIILFSSLMLVACSTGNDSEEGVRPIEPENVEERQDPNVDDAEENPPNEEETPNDDTSSNEENDENNEDSNNQNVPVEDSNSPGIEGLDFPISLGEAIQIFNEEFSHPDIHHIAFDREDGRYVYEFEGGDDYYEYEMTVDAQTGEILEYDQDEDDDIDESVLDLAGIISPLEAMTTALNESNGDYVEEWELVVENGRTVYDVDVEGGRDQYIDANTGEVQ